MLWRMIGIAVALSALALQVGCEKSVPPPPQEEAMDVSAPQNSRLIQKFFVDWLKRHGIEKLEETDTALDLAAAGVKIEGRLTGAWKHPDATVTELQVTVTLKDGRRVVEHLGGTGKDLETAIAEAMEGYMATTFHPLFAAFINPEDVEVARETWEIDDSERAVLLGNWGIQGKNPIEGKEVEPFMEVIRNAMAQTLLDEKDHWLKLVVGQTREKISTLEVTLDNEADEGLQAALRKAPWPMQKEFYMLKLFLVVKGG